MFQCLYICSSTSSSSILWVVQQIMHFGGHDSFGVGEIRICDWVAEFTSEGPLYFLKLIRWDWLWALRVACSDDGLYIVSFHWELYFFWDGVICFHGCFMFRRGVFKGEDRGVLILFFTLQFQYRVWGFGGKGVEVWLGWIWVEGTKWLRAKNELEVWVDLACWFEGCFTVSFFLLVTTTNPYGFDLGGFGVGFLDWVRGYSLNICPCSWNQWHRKGIHS